MAHQGPVVSEAARRDLLAVSWHLLKGGANHITGYDLGSILMLLGAAPRSTNPTPDPALKVAATCATTPGWGPGFTAISLVPPRY